MGLDNRLPTSYFQRYDEAEDRHFYLYPRLTAHLDEAACAAVTRLFSELFPPGGRILDLMSSYVSHLPTDANYSHVVGLGMNYDRFDDQVIILDTETMQISSPSQWRRVHSATDAETVEFEIDDNF